MAPWRYGASMLVWALLPLLAAPAAGSPDDAWSDQFRFPGLLDQVCACCIWEGDLLADDYRWSGSEWQLFGGGLDGSVNAYLIHEGVLYAGGNFSHSGVAPVAHVARWDGTDWQPVGEGLESAVGNLLIYQGRIYAGTGDGLWAWDGQTWTRVLQTNGGVYALVEYAGLLVLGGQFDEVAGIYARSIVGWNGDDPVFLNPPLSDGVVLDLAVHEDRLVSTGHFLLEGSGFGGFVLTWDGTDWDVLGGDLDDTYWHYTNSALISHAGDLYVGGDRGHAGWEGYGYAEPRLLRWDGTELLDLGLSGNGVILTLLSQPEGLVLGGRFYGLEDDAGFHFSPNAVRLGSSGLETLEQSGRGLTGDVTHFAIQDDVLIAGGFFDVAGTTLTEAFAAWDGQGWTAMDRWGLSMHLPYSCALAEHEGWLYAVVRCYEWYDCGEQFGIWFGTNWFGLPIEDGTVQLLSTPFELLCIQGLEILRFEDWSWVSLVSDVQGGYNRCAAMVGGDLVVGGNFTAFEGTPARGIVRFDGNAWYPLGDGVGGRVLAIAEYGGLTVAAGEFSEAGGVPAANVASWDGTQWLALGEGIDGPVNALLFAWDRLYAAGNFSEAGGVPAANVACWDGEHWEALGSGTDGEVLALAMYDGSLYLGGRFITAGGKPSRHLAAWSLEPVGVYVQGLAAVRREAGARLIWRTNTPLDGAAFRVWREEPQAPRCEISGWLPATAVDYTWEDPLAPEGACSYWLESRDSRGQVSWYGPVDLAAIGIPSSLQLESSYPNPFNPSVAFSFVLPQAGPVRLSVHDARGRLVAQLVDETRPAGRHRATWDGCDGRGAPCASGVYLARLETPSGIRTRKVLLAR